MSYEHPDPAAQWMQTPQRNLHHHLRNELQPNTKARYLEKTIKLMEGVHDPSLDVMLAWLTKLQRNIASLENRLPVLITYCEQQSKEVGPSAERNLVTKTCARCEDTFEGSALSKYCSPECRDEVATARKAAAPKKKGKKR